jgi:hypothetical protein
MFSVVVTIIASMGVLLHSKFLRYQSDITFLAAPEVPAAVSPHMILNFLPEKVLGLPRSH